MREKSDLFTFVVLSELQLLQLLHRIAVESTDAEHNLLSKDDCVTSRFKLRKYSW
jgi:hypothetical protein